jgi:hypothetical protein
MKTPNPWQCDVCGRAKGPGNGWLIGVPVFSWASNFSGNEPAGRAHVGIVSPDPTVGISPNIKAALGYALVEWNESLAETCETSPVHHLCSEACAHKRMWENIQRGAKVGPAGPDLRIVDGEATEVEKLQPAAAAAAAAAPSRADIASDDTTPCGLSGNWCYIHHCYPSTCKEQGFGEYARQLGLNEVSPDCLGVGGGGF